MSETTNKSKKPRKKSLTLAEISKIHKKATEYSEYIYDKENNIVIKYYELFDEKKIDELFNELSEHIKYASEKGYDIFTNNLEIINYIQFLIIKHFSEYKDKIGTNFEKNMAVLNEMISIGLFHKFFNEIFDYNEVIKVFDRFYERIEFIDKIQTMPNEILEQIKSMKYKDVIFSKNTLKN